MHRHFPDLGAGERHRPVFDHPLQEASPATEAKGRLKLYDRTAEVITLDEVERTVLWAECR